MNKRLVWNFEINTDNPLITPVSNTLERTEEKWESRYFWPDDQVITLHGLNDSFLALSRYKIKHREDTYYVLPHADYNLKIRHNQLFYKPVLLKKGQAIAYGKKIKLEEQNPNIALPGCAEINTKKLLARINNEGIQMKVEKEALIYTFETTPAAKLELAWLHVSGKGFYSVNIEAHSIQWVDVLTKQILGHLLACDYVTFLKRNLKERRPS